VSTAITSDTPDREFTQLRRLTEISRALTYTTSLEQVTRLTVERGAELLDAPAAVLMLEDACGLMQVRAVHGITEERVARFGSPESHEVIERLQGLFGVADDRMIAVPLVVGGAVTGLVAVATHRPFMPPTSRCFRRSPITRRSRSRTPASAARSASQWRTACAPAKGRPARRTGRSRRSPTTSGRRSARSTATAPSWRRRSTAR
jgi:hypothetical protein